jgi:integrase
MAKLTAMKVKRAKPGTYVDGDGLLLVVRHRSKDPEAPPSRQWVCRLQFQGRRYDIGLGSAKDVDLADARTEAAKLRRIARSGTDPLQARQSAAEAPPPPFREVAAAVHKEHAQTWGNAKHSAQWLATLEAYAYPVLGALPVDRIDSPQIIQALSPIWLTKPETARRVAQRIATVLDYAHGQRWRKAETPMRAVRLGLPKQGKGRGHFDAMPWADVPAFFAGMDDTLEKASETTRLALEFVILTAARSGEARGARWNEIDRKAKVWDVPPGRMKSKRPHRVPLCKRALAILDRMQELRRSAEPDAVIFEGRNHGKPISDMTLRKALRSAGLDYDPHGFRSSFRDWAAEGTSFPPALAEKALAHAVKDKTEAAYQRGDLLDRRRKLMEAWAAYCYGQREKAGNVTPMRRAKAAAR